jgi:hypothetical protein
MTGRTGRTGTGRNWRIMINIPVAHVHRASKRYVKKHRSPLHRSPLYRFPLHEIMHAFRLKPDKMERIPPIRQGPKWEPDFPIHIPATKEAATAKDKGLTAPFKVYSDGSCIGGEIGAAAV